MDFVTRPKLSGLGFIANEGLKGIVGGQGSHGAQCFKGIWGVEWFRVRVYIGVEGMNRVCWGWESGLILGEP